MEWTAEVQFEKNNGNGYNAVYIVNADTEAQARAEALDIAFSIKDVCKASITNIEPKEN